MARRGYAALRDALLRVRAQAGDLQRFLGLYRAWNRRLLPSAVRAAVRVCVCTRVLVAQLSTAAPCSAAMPLLIKSLVCTRSRRLPPRI